MSYTNGIGASQQFLETAGTAAGTSAAQVANTRTTASSAAAQSPMSRANPQDGASLSRAANAVAQALSGSDTRSDKVAALQQSIAAGTYSVSSSAVAEKLFSTMLS